MNKVLDPKGGSNLTQVRAYNERLILSIVRRHGQLAKSEIAKKTGLSAQTISVIIRALEEEGLLLRLKPVKGKVGQPFIPICINPAGAYSLGLKIGRRSCTLSLMDFSGALIQTIRTVYHYPKPNDVLSFLKKGLDEIFISHAQAIRMKLIGIGVAMPSQLWNWAEKLAVPPEEMALWRDYNITQAIERITGLQVFLENDATAACSAELAFGRGAEFSDFVYFYLGSFIGGGIVINHSIHQGPHGNAGALGSIPVSSPSGERNQLIDKASIFTLENLLYAQGCDTQFLWEQNASWDIYSEIIDEWIGEVALYIAQAIVASYAIVDFQTAIIEGGFPSYIRKKLVKSIQSAIQELDLQGITIPEVREASLGRHARTVGSASLPIFARYHLNQNILFKET